ncbi:acetyltransferase [Aminobacter sp. MSH1]|uniref:arsenic resistance N-acetyltransferase ArsN2 n=1 Tax=Aminobacter sp. MSH1 TaxID=374606 RepID=UPI000D38CDB7|nr:arsenic resistance N-acetyltransferase ArsN2 [Aminobacter sp. MSH1]AWC23692.1 acetyltransferase [Aminobacter sp. MSH1]
MSLQVQQIAPHDPEFVAALAAEELPVDDLTEDGRLFFRFEKDKALIGFGGMELVGDYALLRSIVVPPPSRGQGSGKRITEQLLQKAEGLGIAEVYLLTTSAADFFEAAGFERIAREAAPQQILATRQASSLCPSSAALLFCRLSPSTSQPSTISTETVDD